MAFNLFYFIKSWIFIKRTHLIWIFVLIATAIIVLLSCSKQNDPAKIEGTVSLKVNDFIVFGEMHNSFMSNVLEKYQGRGELTSKEEVIHDITDFNLKYAQQNYDQYPSSGLAYLKECEMFLDNNYFKSYCTKQCTRSSKEEIENYFKEGYEGEMPSLDSMIDYLYEVGVLQDNAYKVLKDMVDLIVKSLEGQISDANFERAIDGLIIDFDEQEYKEGSSDGEIVGPVLAISKSSLEWWAENPDACLAEDKLPAVVAADAGGAITGVVIDSIRQGLCIGFGAQNGWDWSSTGWAALGGAVDGSLGLSSKVIKAISNLF
jgi:hypothetical protein